MKHKPKVYGVAKIGTKGQVVIPASARSDCKLKTGDKVFILSGPPNCKDILALVTEKGLSEMLSFAEGHATMIKQVFSSINTKKSK